MFLRRALLKIKIRARFFFSVIPSRGGESSSDQKLEKLNLSKSPKPLRIKISFSGPDSLL